MYTNKILVNFTFSKILGNNEITTYIFSKMLKQEILMVQ